MIFSFAGLEAERILYGDRSRKLPADIQQITVANCANSTLPIASTTFAYHRATGLRS